MILDNMDTITAIATAPGRGGVGIVRVSGRKVVEIAEAILGKLPKPRYAYYGNFLGGEGQVLDRGIALYFPNPNSFTGEDVLELQAQIDMPVLQLVMLAEQKLFHLYKLLMKMNI